ncbi:C69 family dipeptidase [Myxosarcina sp. GI1]|uniref:C69 family dipeptidase n=1 Tax=Myxosarcina sp. GI1 TaxID=1541065 RepID=UPI0005693DA1|nr:C69 family dipeptidase [Myxosarcina sp. GI1]
MCDSMVALPDVTQAGDLIFGKNSDRPAKEIQDAISIPARTYANNAALECTYITIPQVKHTLAVIISQPQWMWGAEMGANECGVVIGNEAVWTREPTHDTGLLGMDLVRLGLERGTSAIAALQVIVELLSQYGQGGNCAEHFQMNYHNSFLIADRNEAWVLETAERYWVAERVISGVRSISNNLSIRNADTIRHPEVVEYAVNRGLCNSEADFDFANIFSSSFVSDVPSPNSREGRVRQLCQLNRGEFSVETAKSILRDHQSNVCMHGEFVSAGSQISSLSPAGDKHWFIERPHPCQHDYQQVSFSPNTKLDSVAGIK